jgi:plasmid stability protein
MSERYVHIRVYPEEKQTIRERAARHDLSMSDYLRTLVEREAREGLLADIYPGKTVNTIKR